MSTHVLNKLNADEFSNFVEIYLKAFHPTYDSNDFDDLAKILKENNFNICMKLYVEKLDRTHLKKIKKENDIGAKVDNVDNIDKSP